MGGVSAPGGPDPRPQVSPGADGGGVVDGRRCRSCDEVSAFAWPACPACGGAVDPASFGPFGTVWSATVVRIPVPGRPPPYRLAYVDLDDGPRVLAHVVTDPTADRVLPAPVGGRVRLLPTTDDGDLLVEVVPA
ncbi:MAG: hypothetical protein JWP64_1430 [Pseudonocardia sp.]|jgi:uncharacterized OB-fold protein|nr:hypothetical protein [Pseudonocardia sp.]MDT7703763.1 uncharacterized protein [Pseudonocardiales bacterium]